jgi:hypothetical protein
MANSQAEVIIAEQALEAARKKQNVERRTQQVAKLKDVRKELSARTKEYDALAKRLLKGDEAKSDLEFEIAHWRAALNALEQQAPDAVRVRELSDDPGVLEYQESHAVLSKKLEALCAKRPQFYWIASTRVDAVNLAATINALTASERDLMRHLTGEIVRDYNDARGGSVRGVA